MPNDWHSMQAAQVLAEIGEPATAAIPALLGALARRDGRGEFVVRWNLAHSLVRLCGGPESAAACIQKHLTHRDPEVRRSAARTLGFLGDFVSHRVLRQPNGTYTPPAEDIALTKGFHQTIPVLARTLASDPDDTVRQSARTALLDSLTYNSGDAPWEKALPPLAAALRAQNIAERQGAARILAEAPTNPVSILPQLRQALTDKDEMVRGYVLVALFRALRSERSTVTEAFFTDLASTNGETRRTTARELEQAVSVLWNSLPPQIGHHNNNRLLFPMHRHERGKEWQEENHRQRALLLAGMTRALADRDAEVRLSTARALEQIGTMVDRGLGHGSAYRTVERDVPNVVTALEKAGEAIRGDDPALAARLITLRERILKPHDRF